MRKTNLISGFIWLSLAIFILYESTQLGLGTLRYPGPGLFLLLICIPLGILSAYLIWESLRNKERVEKNEVLAWDINWYKILFTLLALFIYAIFLEKLGFLLSTLLLMFFLFKVAEQQRWAIPVFGAIFTVFLCYVVFGLWLQVQLPKGIIEEIINLDIIR